MKKINSKIFRSKKNETFSELLKRTNTFIVEKHNKGYSLTKEIVNEKLIVVDYWVEEW